MIYEWHLGPADVYSTSKLTDIVSQIHWSCVGTAPNGSTFKSSGAVQLGSPDPDNFTPFSQMTRSQIESLVYARVDATAIQNQLSSDYAASQTPSVKQFNF